jgi:hypothetical protein
LIDVIWVHIRAVGEWTTKLYEHFISKIPLDSRASKSKHAIQFHRKSPVFVFSENNLTVNQDNTGSQNPILINYVETTSAEDTRKSNSSFDGVLIDNQTFKSSVAETVTLASTIEEGVFQMEKQLEIRLDGPYGSPSSHIFNSEHAVLIATGIGVR